MPFALARQVMMLHTQDGVDVPEQGFNVFGALDKAACAGAGGDASAPGNIYCLGKYRDDATNDSNLKASYIGREWAHLGPADPTSPGA